MNEKKTNDNALAFIHLETYISLLQSPVNKTEECWFMPIFDHQKNTRFTRITQISGIFLGEQRTINSFMCMIKNVFIRIDQMVASALFEDSRHGSHFISAFIYPGGLFV